MGGEGHDGAYLTDTVMLASLKPSSKEVALISFPRDMVSPTNNWRKINSINAYAEQKEEGSGGEETMKSMEELLQLPIHYYVRVDFKGFVNIIDELGGIEINVENTFDDYTYPIYGQEDNPDYYSRFEHLHIDEGPQTMSGTLALKYSRSRHAFGIEGSDFARAKRQQLVLEAAKNKLLSSKTLLNPVIITKLINEFSQNIATNLDVWEMIRLWNLFKDVDRSKIINKVLNDAPDNFLIASKGEDGAYILIPRSGNFAEIKGMIRNIFNNSDVQEMPKETEKITDDSKIIILNGTWITGLAGKTANKLSLSGFDIIETGNADERTFSETVFYDLSYGKKKTSLETLKRITNAKQIFDTPAWVKEYSAGGSEQPDFLLILGEDAN
jgi:LCP family protein required for cell wall assembly